MTKPNKGNLLRLIFIGVFGVGKEKLNAKRRLKELGLLEEKPSKKKKRIIQRPK